MKITKQGRCCLLVEVGEVRLLTDPGNLSEIQNTLENIDAVLITHEHPDHIHVASLESIRSNNPNVEVYVNTETAKNVEGIGERIVIEEGTTLNIKGAPIQTWNCMHEDVYDDITPALNTALLIDNTLFYPGDAYYEPGIEVNALALATEGPWLRTRDAINYALRVKPKLAFPVHDARLDPTIGDARYAHYARVLPKNGIEFKNLQLGESLEI